MNYVSARGCARVRTGEGKEEGGEGEGEGGECGESGVAKNVGREVGSGKKQRGIRTGRGVRDYGGPERKGGGVWWVVAYPSPITHPSSRQIDVIITQLEMGFSSPTSANQRDGGFHSRPREIGQAAGAHDEHPRPRSVSDLQRNR